MGFFGFFIKVGKGTFFLILAVLLILIFSGAVEINGVWVGLGAFCGPFFGGGFVPLK